MSEERIERIEVGKIVPSPFQHRRAFSESDLKELARSIETDGLIQPITVRPVNAHFELIAGERRWRSVKEFTAMQSISARILDVSDIQARRLCATENLQRSDLSAIEEVSALVDIIDTELLDAFEEYGGYGNTSVERVRFVLMKLSAKEDRERQIKNNPDKGWSICEDLIATYNKFIICVVKIFESLPKPKDWRSLYNNDLPLLTSIDDDVQEISVNEKLNKSQTKALQKLKDADRGAFSAAAQKGDGIIRHVYRNYNTYDPDTEPDEPESLRDLSAERISKAAKTITHQQHVIDIQQPPINHQQPIDQDALWIWGRVGEIYEFIEKSPSFESLFKKMTPAMQGKVRRQAVTVAEHIAKFGEIHEQEN